MPPHHPTMYCRKCGYVLDSLTGERKLNLRWLELWDIVQTSAY